jgi:2-hydroxy-6-oxo-6-(2'-carboxyphenyl)-hexa-2,4-dienoate hydrolase
VVSAGGISTRVYESGEGDPLVLVHGGGFGSLYSLDCWSSVLGPLGLDFRVVAFDKLGQGHTGNPPSDEQYTFEALLAHATALLDSLALGPAHLVGHSMGALLVTRIALNRPDLVRTVVVVDSNTLAPDDPRFPWTRFYADLAKSVPPGPPTRETVRMEPDAQSRSRAHVSDDFVARLLEIARRPEHVEAAERIAVLREPIWMPSILAARRQALADLDERGLSVPALVVWAADDLSAPLPLAYSLFEHVVARTEHAELHVIGRSGHYVFREQPAAFTRVVTAFCRDGTAISSRAGGGARRA